MPTGTPRRRRRAGWVVLVLLSMSATALLVVHLIWPGRVDAVALGLVALAALPGLGLVLDSAELPGGIKVQFRDLEQRVTRTEETAQVAMGAATEYARSGRQRWASPPLASATQPALQSTSQPAPPDLVWQRPTPDGTRSATAPAVPAGGDGDSSGGSHRPDRRGAPPEDAAAQRVPPVGGPMVRELADEYVRVRRALPSGPERGRRMTGLVGQLIGRTAVDPDFDPHAAMRTGHPGLRLAGYAYGYVQGDGGLLPDLLRTVADEPLPFSQYWALKALGRLLRRADPADVPAELPRTLALLRDVAGEDTSRLREIEAIEAEFAGRS